MKKVMIVCPRYGPPWNEGVTNMVKLLGERLSESGIAVNVVSRTKNNYPHLLTRRLLPIRIADALAFCWRISRMARQQQVQVIHLFSSLTSILGIKSFIIQTLSGVPLVIHITGLGKPTFGHNLLLRADQVIVGGSYLTEFFPGAMNLPPISPYMNLQSDVLLLTRAEIAARKILFLGAMEPVRGVHTLIDAVAILKKRYMLNDFRLTIAWNGHGDNSYKDLIRAKITDYHLEDHVQWEGSSEDVPALYKAHDIVVIPRASPECMGFPLRIVEAMSYGKPLVVSDVGEMPNIVDGCGVTYPHEDSSALAAALHHLLRDRDFYQKCRMHAYQRAEQYHPSHVVTRLAELYERL
jgi:glycosyltransferase involved in cell wall biosynthesis